MTPQTWSTADIESLLAVADIILPGNETLPNASQAGIHRWISEALRLRPDLSDDALGIAARVSAGETPKTTIHDTKDSPEFDALVVLLTGAYCMSPAVWERLGYEGQEAREVRDDTDSYLDLLMPVFERGERFRPTP